MSVHAMSLRQRVSTSKGNASTTSGDDQVVSTDDTMDWQTDVEDAEDAEEHSLLGDDGASEDGKQEEESERSRTKDTASRARDGKRNKGTWPKHLQKVVYEAPEGWMPPQAGDVTLGHYDAMIYFFDETYVDLCCCQCRRIFVQEDPLLAIGVEPFGDTSKKLIAAWWKKLWTLCLDCVNGPAITLALSRYGMKLHLLPNIRELGKADVLSVLAKTGITVKNLAAVAEQIEEDGSSVHKYNGDFADKTESRHGKKLDKETIPSLPATWDNDDESENPGSAHIHGLLTQPRSVFTWEDKLGSRVQKNHKLKSKPEAAVKPKSKKRRIVESSGEEESDQDC